MSQKRISVILPVYNEASQMNDLLKTLQFIDQSKIQHELIIVDGGSQDQTVMLLEQAGYQVFQSPKGRGNQLRMGAQKANGDIYFFLHADHTFKSDPLVSIIKSLEESSVGAFPICFMDESSWILRVIRWGSNWRLRRRNIAFGDQGMYMTAKVYDKVGGFRAIPLMEDYDLSIRLKQLGYTFQVADQPIYASSRRFDQTGGLRLLIRMQYCQWLFRRNVPIERINEIYYRK